MIMEMIQTKRMLGFMILEHSEADDSLIIYRDARCRPSCIKTSCRHLFLSWGKFFISFIAMVEFSTDPLLQKFSLSHFMFSSTGRTTKNKSEPYKPYIPETSKGGVLKS